MTRVVLVIALAACVAPATSSAPAPLVGVDGSHDAADRNCNVVLRSLEGWQATIEISSAAAAEQLAPTLMISADGTTWQELATTASSDAATPGYARFSVAVPASTTELVPLIHMAQGGRLFDHNRNPGDLDNYTVAAPDFAIWPADAVCAPASGPQAARLVFAADFTQHRDGVLAPGGEVTVSYDLARLPQCRGGAWDVIASVRFEPAGELRTFSMRGGDVTIPVPPDARRAVLWFENTGDGCTAWDSSYGANYAFDCATPPQWVGDASNLLTRDDSGDLCGGTPAADGFTFDTWARQRATITNLCFAVYQAGMTDHDDPDLWQKLDVSLRWRGDSAAPWQITPVSFDRRVGNNARYAFSWRTVDPFRPYHCPDVPTTTDASGMVNARLDYYVVVNGYELRPEPGAAFAAMFSDDAGDPWRTANCQ